MSMKTFLKVFDVAVVAIVVFLGALYIFEGVRMQEEKAVQTAAEHAQAAEILDILNAGEGSAL